MRDESGATLALSGKAEVWDRLRVFVPAGAVAGTDARFRLEHEGTEGR